MNVLVYLVPLALGLGLTGLFAFLWALRSGQYSDLEGAGLRVLSDDDLHETKEEASNFLQLIERASDQAQRKHFQ
jgi:cbb3-type cytochrome oxidase maturation protein